MMNARNSTLALALFASAFSGGVAQAENDTEAALSDVAAQATIDNCPCPFPDSADREVKKFEACLKKSSANALQAFKKAIKFVGASSSDFKSSLKEAVTDYDAECRASWEAPSDDEGDGEEFLD